MQQLAIEILRVYERKALISREEEDVHARTADVDMDVEKNEVGLIPKSQMFQLFPPLGITAWALSCGRN